MLTRSRRIGTGLWPAAVGLGGFGIAVASLGSVSAHAQDANALVNILVKKGILSDQEATEVRAEMQKEVSQSPAGKINLSNSVTQLSIYGDLRLRYQYSESTPIVANSTAFPANEQDRWRYRFRLNADWLLGPDWFVGFQLRTNQASDSGTQTYSTAFSNDNIYISRAFLGYQNDWLRFVGGKQPNPFYTSDLLWDPDISPSGLAETINLSHWPFFGGTSGPDGAGKQSATATERSSLWGDFARGGPVHSRRRYANSPAPAQSCERSVALPGSNW